MTKNIMNNFMYKVTKRNNSNYCYCKQWKNRDGSTFSFRDKGTHHNEFVPNRRLSCILREVWVALATSDVQSTLEIVVTDEIHMEDRKHGLAWTKPNNALTHGKLQMCQKCRPMTYSTLP